MGWQTEYSTQSYLNKYTLEHNHVGTLLNNILLKRHKQFTSGLDIIAFIGICLRGCRTTANNAILVLLLQEHRM